MKRLTRWTVMRPGYDCKNAPCEHTPKGDHGIHCDEWVYVVTDGARAVNLTVFTGVYPPTANVSGLPDRLRYPWATDLGRHLPEPGYEGETAHGECFWLGGKTCFYDGTSLGAEDFYRVYGRKDAKSSEQDERFWRALEEEFWSRAGRQP